MPEADPSFNTSTTTLGALLTHAGAGLLEVSMVRGDLDTPVHRAVVVGSAIDDPVGPGDLVLMVGIDADDPVLEEVVARAAEMRAAAVVVRAEREEIVRLNDIAAACGVSVVRTPPGVTWDQLYLFLDAALSTIEAPSSTPVADVPVGDLFALANAVATVVGGPVTIEDAHSTVLAFSSELEDFDEPRRQSILGRRTPEKWVRKFRDAGIFQRFSAGDEVVHVDHFVHEGLKPRLVVPIRAGGEVLGSIWAAQGDRPFGPGSEAALTEAGRIAAVQLLRTRATSELERHMRGDVLRSLFDGSADVALVAARLGLAADTAVAVVAMRASRTEGRREAAERALPVIRLLCEGFHRRSSCIADGETVYVLLPVAEGGADARVLVDDLVERVATGLGVELRAGIGPTVIGLARTAASREDADEVLRVLETMEPGRRVGDSEELATGIVLARLHRLLDGSRHPHRAQLDALRRYDLIHHTNYISTLGAWLSEFGDVGSAATVLGIHPNTLRYRLRRLAELGGFDLNDPDERLVLQLELELASMEQAGGG